jgi:5-methylcytosine-specific restriction endonuclease McrA
MDYNNYLQSLHWKQIRQERLDYQNICQICSKNTGLNIHHKYYVDKENKSILFHENIKDFMTLCKSCHRLVHKYFGIDAKKMNKKALRVKRLMQLGILKNKAFWIVANPDLYLAIKNHIIMS